MGSLLNYIGSGIAIVCGLLLLWRGVMQLRPYRQHVGALEVAYRE